MDSEILDVYFRYNDAVVLSGYGTGGIPEGDYYGFYEIIESWKNKGKTLVVTTQVQSEGSDMSIYRVGRGLKKTLFPARKLRYDLRKHSRQADVDFGTDKRRGRNKKAFL